MKFSKKQLKIALFFLLTISFTACTKELSNHLSENPITFQGKVSGVVADDPAKVAKVPTIMSQDFLLSLEKTSVSSDQLNGKVQPGKKGNDVTAPIISFTSPVAGASIAGTISVTVNATDNVGVASVSLGVDGTTIGTSFTSPFSQTWNSASVTNGNHTLTVTAKDAAGNAASSSIQVSVNNVSGGDITNPTVSITSPSGGSSVSGTVAVTINATDNVGVSSVKFSVDGSVVGTENAAPYSFSWNTSTVAAGFHTLTATATDAAGNSGVNSIQVTVNTVVIDPATIPASFQLLTPTPGNQGNEGSCVPFAIAYAARSIEQYYKTNASLYSYDLNIFSPEYVYNQTKFSDCGSGTSILTVLDLLQTQGVCTWQSMPYSDVNGCSLQPDASQIANASNYKISSYAKIVDSDQVAIKTMIASNHPVITTIIADNSFVNAGPGFIWKTYSGSGSLPHTLIICGYDDAKHAYKVMNSWGTSWGDAGFSWIDYDLFPQYSSYYTYTIQ